MAMIWSESKTLRETVAIFKVTASSVRKYTADMLTEAEELCFCWENDICPYTFRQFQALIAQFEDICKTIEMYGAFLEELVARYDAVEAAISVLFNE